MTFVKGHKKLGGRTKGTPNQKTFRELVEDKMGQSIPERLLQLCIEKPADEKDILKAMLPYAYPKLQNVEMSGSMDTNVASIETRQQIEKLAEKLASVKSEL